MTLFNLRPENTTFEPTSMYHFDDDLTLPELEGELWALAQKVIHTWTPEEVVRILRSILWLGQTAASLADKNMDDREHTMLTLRALDTAMTWERG